MMKIIGVIFDYGGTLDSRGDHWSEVIFRAYEAEHAEVTHERFRDAYVYAERVLGNADIILPTDTFLATMEKKVSLQMRHLNINRPELNAAIARRCYDYARQCVSESLDTLRTIASRCYPIAIVSNFYGNLRTVLDDFGVTPLLCAAIDSTVAGIRKPDPAIFRCGIDAISESISRYLSPPEILVVGDSITNDILPAASLGCHTAYLSGISWYPSQPLPAGTLKLNTIADLLGII